MNLIFQSIASGGQECVAGAHALSHFPPILRAQILPTYLHIGFFWCFLYRLFLMFYIDILYRLFWSFARGSSVWRCRARTQPRRANMRAQPAGDCSIGLLLLRLLGERTSRSSINKLLYKYTAVVLIIFILNLVYLIQYVYRARASERRYSLARSNERSMSTGVRSYRGVPLGRGSWNP